MAIIVEMPKLSDTSVTGRILSWLKNEGDPVQSGETIAEIETDKAAMDLEAEQDGHLLKIIAQIDEEISAGGPIAILGRKDETIDELIREAEGRRQSAAQSGE